MRGTRALLTLVIVMGVLIVVATTAMIAVVVHRLTHSGPTPGMTAPLSLVVVPAVRQEPAGTRITAMVRQSDRLLAIALSGGGPDRVLVWDLSAGRALTEIRLGP